MLRRVCQLARFVNRKKAKLAIVDSLQGGRGWGGKTVRYTDDLVRAVFVACRYFLRDTPLL